MNNPRGYDLDSVLQKLSDIIDHPAHLTMAPLRQLLADGNIRTFDDVLTFILAIGARAGRSGIATAGAFIRALTAIRDLDEGEITRLLAFAEALGAFDGDAAANEEE
jgi:hypothetical protein